jgi:hypothetical protein
VRRDHSHEQWHSDTIRKSSQESTRFSRVLVRNNIISTSIQINTHSQSLLSEINVRYLEQFTAENRDGVMINKRMSDPGRASIK